jgi:hypothetical protein
VVLADSHGIPRAPCYSGNHQTSYRHFSYGGLTLYAGPFACPSPTPIISDSPTIRQNGQDSSHNPTHATPAGFIHARGLASSGFAHHYSRNHMLFSLPAGTEMFHFPAFPPHRLYIQRRVTAHNDCRVPPFGHPRITARLTTPRGLSRPPTSFIGSWCQGIHHAPLTTWPQMLASTMHKSTNNENHNPPHGGPCPQTPNSVPPPRPLNGTPAGCCQRSTHEQASADRSPASWR